MQHRRLYISADIEGVAGVASPEHMTPAGFEYEKAREWMTSEVNAACISAFECGIEEIVVSDSHGNGQNLCLDDLPQNVHVVRSWPRPLCMMDGIEQGFFDAAMLLGYHSGARDLRGVLAHTLSTRGVREIKINGKTASETVISGLTAAHFNVPVILVSGDDAYTEHAQSVFDDIELATVKWACSTTSTRTLLPQYACKLIADKTKCALNRLSDFKPQTIKRPIVVELDCVNRQSSELLGYLEMFDRTTATTVKFVSRDMVEVSKVFSFLLASGVL